MPLDMGFRPALSRRSGSAREPRVRDRDGSHLTSQSTHGNYTLQDATPHITHTSRQRQLEHPGYPTNHLSQQNNSYDPPYQYPHSWQYGYDAHRMASPSQAVPRDWNSPNPQVNHVVNSAVLQDAISRLGGQAYQNHDHSDSTSRNSARRSHALPNEYHFLQPPSAYHDATNNRPPGLSDGQDRESWRPPRYSEDRRLYENQRAGPYDAVGFVVEQSDHEYEGYEGFDEEIDRDARSSVTYC
ncbi:hypothetical protein EK21DRAFT_107519 [Setomelanomma holmii]|uniref:Uncharacterized protein n=1 Tax=Setomelanomma holmii TaxID=210430 RepID=A0A9P4HGR4_9PLEO|nr:hypothetical protein EK21DRAFT_107519 [Setomelanomma holmii]